MKIIDAHAHIAQYISGFTARGELRGIGCGKAQYCTGEIFQMFPPELGDFGVSPEAIIKVMDLNGIEKAVLLQGSYLGFHNDYIAEAVKKYPKRFTAAATYDPFCIKVHEIRKRLFKDLGFKAVKFELSTGAGLMANRQPFYIDGKLMNDCFKHAADNGLTVVLDIGRPNEPCWQIDAIASVVNKYPETNFVMCHLLSVSKNDTEQLKYALDKLVAENVYFDLASLATNQKEESYPYPAAINHIKAAVQSVGSDKLMFGSDMPCSLSRDSYAHLKNYVVASGVFNKTELKNIFYNTADKVYFNI